MALSSTDSTLAVDRNNAPLTFRDAWAKVMRNPTTRAWAFNRNPPNATELMRARENQPFLKSAFLEPPRTNNPLGDDMYRKRLDEMFMNCYRLRDGTVLGFTINGKCADLAVNAFRKFHPSFQDTRLIVSRLIVSSIGKRLFVISFNWLVSGAFGVRCACYRSLSDAKSSDLSINIKVLAFNSTDANILSAVALCPGQPNLDFLHARFENYLLSDDWYMLEIADIMFQSACVFCAVRGSAVCSCPLPIRRRAASSVVAYKVRPGKSLWDEFNTVQFTCGLRGRWLFNLSKTPGTPYRRVLGGGMSPYETMIELNITTHGCLQMHLGLTGVSAEAAISFLTPFTVNNHGKRRLMGAPSSSDSNSWSSTILVPTASNASYEHEMVDIVELIKRPKKDEEPSSNVAIVDEWVNWDDNETELEIESTVDEAITLTVDETIESSTVFDPAIVELVTARKDVANDNPKEGLKISNETNRKKNGSEKKGGQNGEVAKVFECPECGVQIRNKRSNLKRHIQVVHKKERNFHCEVDECGQRFQTKTNLKRHVNSVHKGHNYGEPT